MTFWQSEEPVVVAIVSYGRPDDVVACLTALARSSFAAFEVVIVENRGAAAFDDLTAALGRSFAVDGGGGVSRLADPHRAGDRALRWRRYALQGGQGILVLEACDNLGYGGGVNLALRAIEEVPGWRGVWILNPDTEPEPRALEALVEYAEAGGYGLVGCRLVLLRENRIHTRGGYWRPLIARGKSIGYSEPIDAPVDVAAIERRLRWVSGAAAYASRAFVESVGPMNEKFFLYREDAEWSLRGRRFRLGYAHDAIVRHAYGTAIGSAASIRARSDLSVYLAERNALLFTREQFPWLYPFVVLMTSILLADYLVRGNRRIFAAACRGWWAGLRGETGRPRNAA